jgi:MerR family transcriptional regulator, thiopeptide resistance regulator
LILRLYTVSEVAKLSGVSVRTLHHYDEIGLLKPARVGANGYRHYGQDELLRLQQILFHREIGLPLGEIAKVLDAPDFDRAEALRAHRRRLLDQTRRHRRLIRTIDETLAALEGATTMDNKRIYRGFDLEAADQAGAEDWLRTRFGGWVEERIQHSRAVGAGWSEDETEAYLQEGREFDAAIAEAIAKRRSPTSKEVQALVRQHCATVCRGWGVPAVQGSCLTLAEIYRDMPQFRQRFEQIGPGAAAFVADAIQAYAERELT